MNGLILVSGIIASLLWLYIVVNDDVIPYEWTSKKENIIYGLMFICSCTVILGITYTLMLCPTRVLEISYIKNFFTK